MDTAGHESDRGPADVRAKLTRRPKRRRRQFSLVSEGRLKGLAAPFDSPGMELAEVPVIGPIVLIIFVVIVVVVLVVLFGGFLIAFIELILLGVLGLAGSLWAWLRGHPKVAVVDVGKQRWVRHDGPAVSLAEDQRAIRTGTDPSTLGYQRAG